MRWTVPSSIGKPVKPIGLPEPGLNHFMSYRFIKNHTKNFILTFSLLNEYVFIVL
jgi:hypothetical protein